MTGPQVINMMAQAEAATAGGATAAATSTAAGHAVVETPRAPAAHASALAGVTPRRSRLRWGTAFLPALAAAVALAVHRWIPDGQAFSEPTGLYPRILLFIIAAGTVL